MSQGKREQALTLGVALAPRRFGVPPQQQPERTAAEALPGEESVDRALRCGLCRRAPGPHLDRSNGCFLFLAPQETGTLLGIRYTIKDKCDLRVIVGQGATVEAAA